MLCKKRVLRNFAKFTGKYLCQSFFFNEVAILRSATLFKKRFWHRCFPLNFAKFLRTSFLKEHLRWLLIKPILESQSVHFSDIGLEKYPWLDYDISKDSVTCHICKQQNKKSNLFAEQCKKDVFLESGCKKWMKATINLTNMRHHIVIRQQ